METSNNVDTTIGRLKYQLNLDLSLSLGDEPSQLIKTEVENSSRAYYKMSLVRDIKMTSAPSTLQLEDIKWENCAIKISMDSVDGEEQFSKWFHLEGKTDSWKDFISKEKCDQLFLNNNGEEWKKFRGVSLEIVVFGLVDIRAWDTFSCSIEILNNRAIDYMSVVQTNFIPFAWSSFDSESSTVIFAIDGGGPGETVEGNKFLLAACSPVLRKMLFETSMAEKSSERINLTDTSFPALEAFIGLISGEKLTCFNVLWTTYAEEIFNLLALAHKYQVQGIIDLCIMIVMAKTDSEMNITEVRQWFQVGKLYEIPELCTRSFEWIRRSSLNAAKWVEILGFLEKEAGDLLSEFCYYFTMYSLMA